MYCSNCGKQLPDEAIACSYCAAIFNKPLTDESHSHCSVNCNDCQTPPPIQHHCQYQHNHQGYIHSPQQQVLDAGHGYALACMLCGILSLFVGGIFCAITSLILANSYQKIGNGANTDKIKTGKTCAWVSIGLTIGVIILYFISIFTLFLIGGNTLI